MLGDKVTVKGDINVKVYSIRARKNNPIIPNNLVSFVGFTNCSHVNHHNFELNYFLDCRPSEHF